MHKKRIFSYCYIIYSQKFTLKFWFLPLLAFANFSTANDAQNIISFSESCMGTLFRIYIDEDSRKIAEQAAKSAFREAHRLNTIFSDYDSESELSRFVSNSKVNQFFNLSSELSYILNESQKLAIETQGCFDVTLGPLSRLWRIARFKKKMPDQIKLKHAIARVGYQNLIIRPDRQLGKILKDNMVIDLGGIAKGYTADSMLKILRNQGVKRVLIDAGGDLVIGDAPRNRKGWKIEIGGHKHPELPILHLANTAVATSGDIEQSVLINGITYSHLIDPRTGLGLTHKSQVSVIAPTGIEADSLASASLVMGKEVGIKFLESKKNLKAYFVQVDSNNTTFLETR